VLAGLNLALKFLLELAAFAAFGYWGSTAADGGLAVLLAILAPAGAIVLWAVFAAPRSRRRLPLRLRVPFELVVFALAAAALLASAGALAAIVFASAVVVNSALLSALHQWEQ
jgi:Protein of unknown function (DUF2568)